MIHSYEGVERTPAWTELVPVLVVRVPVMSAEQKAGLRAEIASSILDGLLLLEDGLNYKVVDLPLPRAWTPLLQEDVPESEPPRPTGRNAAEKRAGHHPAAADRAVPGHPGGHPAVPQGLSQVRRPERLGAGKRPGHAGGQELRP